MDVYVTAESDLGGRTSMEDYYSVQLSYPKSTEIPVLSRGLSHAFLGVFDGHGGKEAAMYVRDHLWETIVQQPYFFSDQRDTVCLVREH